MASLRNASGCVDTVQRDVVEAEEREEARVKRAVRAIKAVADALGFEFEGRFTLVDRDTGRVWR